MQKTKWLVLADQRTAQIFAVQMRDDRRWHMTLYESIDNRWYDYHVHEAPLLYGKRSASSPQHVLPSSSSHEEHEESRRFARDIASWLVRKQQAPIDADTIAVFAAPRFAGILRQELGEKSVNKVRVAELVGMQPQQLLRHPAVREALKLSKP